MSLNQVVQVQNWLNLRYELNRVGRRILTLCELKLLDEDLSRLKTWYQTMVKKKKIKGGRKKSNRESVHSCVNYINLMVYRSDPL